MVRHPDPHKYQLFSQLVLHRDHVYFVLNVRISVYLRSIQSVWSYIIGITTAKVFLFLEHISIVFRTFKSSC